MKKNNFKKLITAALSTVFLIAGCSSATTTATSAANDSSSSSTSSEASDTVNIGGLWELTGATAAYGVVQDNAVQLAIEERNAAGGIDGKEVVYSSYDNQGAPEEAAAGMSYLIDEGNDVVLGPATAALTFAAQPIAEKAEVPFVSATTTVDNATINTETGSVWEYFFRTSFQISFQGSAIAEFANQQGYQTAAVLKDNSTDYGQNLTDIFVESFDGEVVVDESYISGDTDFSSVLTNVKAQNPDVIFIAGYYQEAGPIIKQAREMGIDIAIVGPNGLGNQNIIDLAGAENMTNVYYVAHFVYTEDSPQEVQDFYNAYVEKFGTEPDMFSAVAYDAANMVMDAVDAADSTDSTAIKDAIAATKDFQGIAYDITFDAEHNVSAPAYIQEVVNGEPTDNVTIIEPEN
ncbi:branched-chain amino acid ABC transporter substrate-binding protein [Aerococcus agrisoli]|uniref:Branched-chain amino acid ABC transporter substrate-binding protein n=2 Tax=Aerococcus agrisoli TaxID=2487350 RepID=A0A3N4G9H8_9LACT|nr:branched-chain amino acid ABC transporter substrate-binding protein [Aerococcus agrisoli]